MHVNACMPSGERLMRSDKCMDTECHCACIVKAFKMFQTRLYAKACRCSITMRAAHRIYSKKIYIRGSLGHEEP